MTETFAADRAFSAHTAADFALADAADRPLPAHPSSVQVPDRAPARSGGDADALQPQGRIVLDCDRLRRLRQDRLMSQQDLANDCWRRNIRVSIATIKRAESGRAVRFRIARELARCFEVPVAMLVRV
jgi:ribosome-binding protein aMBF1 (putative translation factor)